MKIIKKISENIVKTPIILGSISRIARNHMDKCRENKEVGLSLWSPDQ